MFEIVGSSDWQITVRHRIDRHAWRFQVGPNTARTQRILLSGKSIDQAEGFAPAEHVVDALLFAAAEGRRLNLID